MIIREDHYSDGTVGNLKVPDGSLRMIAVGDQSNPAWLSVIDRAVALGIPHWRSFDFYMPIDVAPAAYIEAYAAPENSEREHEDPGCPNCGEVGGKPMVREDVDRESGYSALVDCCSLCYLGPNTSRAGISAQGGDADCFVSQMGDDNAE